MNRLQKRPEIQQAFRMNVCRGIAGTCRFALEHGEDLAEKLREVLQRTGWNEYLLSRLSGKLFAHQQFSVGLAACPNGCSRPQIVDFGVILAAAPTVNQSVCTGCGGCIKACREGAVRHSPHAGIEIDNGLCLGCKECRIACNFGAITFEQTGFRVLVGGRLGRHPRLGTELPGMYRADDVARLLAACLQELMKRDKPGMKLAAVIMSGWLPTL